MQDPPPPDDLPGNVAATLRDLDGHDLREAVVYAQLLLRARHQRPPVVDPGPGEEVVRTVERDGHTEIHKRQPCAEGCPDCPHGPYVYLVTRERGPDGEVNNHWTLLGRAEDGDGEANPDDE